MNEAKPGSSHVGVLTGAYLLTKAVAYTSDELKVTHAKEEDSRWQNIYTKIPQLLCDVVN